MRFTRVLKFAAFTGLIAALPAAAQTTIVVNPSLVSLSATQPTATVQIWAAGTLNPTTTFVPTYPVNGAEPWLILQPAGATDGTTPCTACQAGTEQNKATFTVRLIPSRMPANTYSGSIVIGGAGIRQNYTVINANIGGTSSTAITASPMALAFTGTDVGPKLINLSVFGAIGVPTYSLGLTYTSGGSDWLVVSPLPNQGPVYNNSQISVTANPAGRAVGTYTANLTITRSGTTFADAIIPITMTIGATGNVITASPASLSLSTAAPSAIVTISISPAVAVPYSLASTNEAILTAAGPQTGQLINGSPITISAVNAAATPANSQATLRIIPAADSGFSEIQVQVTINATAGTRYFSVVPAQVYLNTTTPTSTVTISPSVATEAVPVSMTLSTNLQQLQTSGLFQMFAPITGQVGPGSSTISFGILNPSAIPANTQGSLTITPLTASGYAQQTIPIYLNGTGTGGISSLTVSPTSLSIEATAGSTTATTRTVTVASTDFYTTQFFTASATTTTGSGWLSVSQTTQTTPGTLTVSVDSSQLQAGTYTGSVVVTPYFSSVGQAFPVTIPVTVTVASSFTVSFNPTAVAITAPSSGQPVTSRVQVNLASGAANPQFTTSVSTDNGGNWLSVTSSSSTLPATLTVSVNPQGLTPGFVYAGRVNILSGTATVASVPVNATITQPASLQLSPATLAFAHQTTSTSNPPAQTVQVSTSGANVSWSATATSTGNWLQVSPSSGSTPGTLSVSVVPTGLAAGTYNGEISVSSSGASNSPQRVTVALTVTTPAVPQVVSVVNAASGAPTVAVPGLIFTITGNDLGGSTPAEAVVSGGAIDTTLGGVRVLFDGIPAPLLYVSANQVNGVMPFELYGRFSTRMQVEARSQRSREVELRVADSAPGIFTLNASGSGQGAILNENGSVNGTSNQAERGSVVVIYGTGQGQTNPPSVTGRIATQIAAPLASPVRVTIGGREAQVLYAGPAPGLVSGAMQINAVVPADTPTGSVPVTVQVGGAASQSNVMISIR